MKHFAIAILFLALATSAFAATTETVITDCKAFVTAQYDSTDQALAINRCFGYVAGFMDEAQYEMIYADTAHTKLSIGSWEAEVKPGQVIRVFVKYVSDNPETLNKPAVFVLWLSAVKSGLYKYADVPVQPVEN